MKEKLAWLKETDRTGKGLLIGAAGFGAAALAFSSSFLWGGTVALLAAWYVRERKIRKG